MVRLIPVRAYHADPAKVDPSTVASPVYDVMGDAERDRYGAVPHNAAAFTSRAHGQSVDQFIADAQHRLETALRAGAYRQDDRPSLYVYGIRYAPPSDVLEMIPAGSRRKEYLLLGVVGGLDLDGGRDREVARHERTFADRVEERVRLTEATGMHFAPIMAGYTMPDHEVNNQVEDALGLDRRALSLEGTQAPLVEARVDGALHRLWRIEDAAVRDAIAARLDPVRLLILDGHHRYTASLARRQAGKRDVPLTMVVEGRDRALLLLPWHRVVPGDALDPERLRDRARARFPDLAVHTGLPDMETALDALREIRKEGRRGFVAVSGEATITVRGPPSAHEGADYELLHRFLEGDLGLDPRSFHFLRSPRGALEKAREEGGTAFLIPGLSVEGVERTVFGEGTLMAQKSTMFLPKVAEGVVFAPADVERTPE